MTREETKRAVEVMNAYINGKEIEYKNAICDWESTNSPCWNWDSLDYRVKPQSQYVPYDDVSEVQRDKWVRHKDSTILQPIIAIDREKEYHIRIGITWYTLKQFLGQFVYEDGTPCGKLVSE